ncbi:hypothetical protein D021_0922A, partial [Vibrio parahaemolyticus 10296]
MMPASAA